ncbi:hypothetical protein MPTA5024_02500 [Microbispora sp. ATCC PTA-5024]|nr:hypothetical protein MPTA5024_02500 [Microbispora sp. ATCC PTA-5024]
MVRQQHVDVREQLVERVDEPALLVLLGLVAVQVLDDPGKRLTEVTGDDLPCLLLPYGLLLPFRGVRVDGHVSRVDLGQVVHQRVPRDPAEVEALVDERGEADGHQAQGEGVLRVVLVAGDVLRHRRGPFDPVRREDQLAHHRQQRPRIRPGAAARDRRRRDAGVVRCVPRHRAALASSAHRPRGTTRAAVGVPILAVRPDFCSG